jgi:hypothetical protein
MSIEKKCTLCSGSGHIASECPWIKRPTLLFALYQLGKSFLRTPTACLWAPWLTFKTLSFTIALKRVQRRLHAEGNLSPRAFGYAMGPTMVKTMGRRGVTTSLMIKVKTNTVTTFDTGLMEYMLATSAEVEA